MAQVRAAPIGAVIGALRIRKEGIAVNAAHVETEEFGLLIGRLSIYGRLASAMGPPPLVLPPEKTSKATPKRGAGLTPSRQCA